MLGDFARRRGWSLDKARRVLYVPRLADVVADAIRSYRTVGDLAGLERLRAPIETALLVADDPPALTAALVMTAQGCGLGRRERRARLSVAPLPGDCPGVRAGDRPRDPAPAGTPGRAGSQVGSLTMAPRSSVGCLVLLALVLAFVFYVGLRYETDRCDAVEATECE